MFLKYFATIFNCLGRVMFCKKDISRNEYMLEKGQARCGYDWWWHSFTATNARTGEEKPFFLEFFICNPELGGVEPVFGQLEENKKSGKRPSYLMVKVGTWGEDAKQLHRFFGWNKVEIKKDAPFSVKAVGGSSENGLGDCFLCETESYGQVCVSEEDAKNHPEYMSDSGSIKWNLKIEKKIPFNVGYGASKLFRSLQLFEMFWHAEGMKSYYSGEIEYNGEKYVVTPEKSYGYADKNWGKDFTSPWVWLSSNNMTSRLTGRKLENSVFDIGGGRPKVGPLVLNRKLLSAFYYEGECYEFNFSKFWTNTRTFFDCKETETQIVWHVEQRTWRTRMVTDITCEKKDMLLVNYESPKGEKRHNRLWNGGNGKGTVKLYKNEKLIDEIDVLNVGCEYGEFDS